jgi:hypothetical protein
LGVWGSPSGLPIRAQPDDVLYDEARVPAYTFRDPLVLNNGERVRDAATSPIVAVPRSSPVVCSASGRTT